VSGREEVEILRRRAEEFTDLAKRLDREGLYSLAAFSAEQAMQLTLKYILAKQLGYFPRTHSMTKLFNELASLDISFKQFYEKHELVLKHLEDSYILSRYLPREYNKAEVAEMLKVLDRFREELGKWT